MHGHQALIHPAFAADVLHMHRNTLDCRLRRMAELTGRNLGHIADRLLLYGSSLPGGAQRQRHATGKYAQLSVKIDKIDMESIN